MSKPIYDHETADREGGQFQRWSRSIVYVHRMSEWGPLHKSRRWA